MLRLLAACAAKQAPASPEIASSLASLSRHLVGGELAAVEKVPQCVSATLTLFPAPPSPRCSPAPPRSVFLGIAPAFRRCPPSCLAPQPRRDGCARCGVRARHGQQCDHLQPAQCPGLVPCPQRQGSALAACIRRQVRAPGLEQRQKNQLGHHADVMAGMPVL